MEMSNMAYNTTVNQPYAPPGKTRSPGTSTSLISSPMAFTCENLPGFPLPFKILSCFCYSVVWESHTCKGRHISRPASLKLDGNASSPLKVPISVMLWLSKAHLQSILRKGTPRSWSFLVQRRIAKDAYSSLQKNRSFRVTLYMTVEPSEARQETSITTAFQSCDDTGTSSELLGFFAFETDF